MLNKCARCGLAEARHGLGEHEYERDPSLPQWHGWHAFGRGLATNLHALGVDDKTIQRILRHSNVSITQKCYIKAMPAQVTDAMAQFGGNTENAEDSVKAALKALLDKESVALRHNWSHLV